METEYLQSEMRTDDMSPRRSSGAGVRLLMTSCKEMSPGVEGWQVRTEEEPGTLCHQQVESSDLMLWVTQSHSHTPASQTLNLY